MQILVVLIFFLLGYNYFIEISNKEKSNIVSSIQIEDELIFGMQKIENINYFINSNKKNEDSILNRPEIKKIVSNMLKRSKLEDVVLLNDIIILQKVEQNIKLDNQNINIKSNNTNDINILNSQDNNNSNNVKTIEDHISNKINNMIQDIKIEKNLLGKYNPLNNKETNSNNKETNFDSNQKINDFNNQIAQINNVEDFFILKVNKNDASQNLIGHSIDQNIKINNQIFNIVNIIKPFKYNHVRH